MFDLCFYMRSWESIFIYQIYVDVILFKEIIIYGLGMIFYIFYFISDLVYSEFIG